MTNELSRYEQDRRNTINEVARMAAEESMRHHLSTERASKQAALAIHEQQLHGHLTKVVVADAIDTVATAREMAGNDELFKAVAGPLVQAYLNRTQDRLESFGQW